MILPSNSMKRNHASEQNALDTLKGPPPVYTPYAGEGEGSGSTLVGVAAHQYHLDVSAQSASGSGLRPDCSFARNAPAPMHRSRSEQRLAVPPPLPPRPSSIAASRTYPVVLSPSAQDYDSLPPRPIPAEHDPMSHRHRTSLPRLSIANSPISTTSSPPPRHPTNSSSSNKIWPTSAPAGLSPINYISISRKATIRGAFAVDTMMRMPASWLEHVPRPNDETAGQSPHAASSPIHTARVRRRDRNVTPVHSSRKTKSNLFLSVQRGHIDVDLYLVGRVQSSPDGDSRPKSGSHTRLDLRISKPAKETRRNRQPLLARVHAPPSPRAPFRLNASAVGGYIGLHIPRSFNGVLTIIVASGNVGKHAALSPPLRARAFLFGEASESLSYFVRCADDAGGGAGTKLSDPFGEGMAEGPDGWDGDAVVARVENGKIRIQFDDENDHDLLRRVSWRGLKI